MPICDKKGSSTQSMGDYEYTHHEVPDDPELNVFWRAETLRLAAQSHSNAIVFRQQIMDHCRKDFWYWAKGFCFVHEPRILDDDAEEFNTKVSFLPWPHQIPVVDRILKVLGKRDLRVVKSRAQGASWILVLIFIWCWLFKPGFKGNLVSKDEVAVDRRNDMDSLFGKADWLLEKLPVWMVGKKNKHWRRGYGEHYLTRMDGETAITGYACTADVASGGRAMVFGMDEHAKHPRGPDREALAATQPITRCRLFISTPKGRSGAYYEIIHDDTIEEPVLYLSWRDNPTQNRGLYQIVKGQPVVMDEEKYGPLLSEYQNHEQWTKLKERLSERGYDLTGKATRSQWYDQECLRPGANPVLVAQEYDMVFGAEGAQYFAEALINRLKNCVRRPKLGEYHVNSESLTGNWTENPDGRFRMWCELDIRKSPPMGEYVVGCDISAGLGGSGGSNSAITVFSRRTGQKVMSFATPSVKPYEFAEIAIAICKWFCNYKSDPAFLIWENQGPGKEFCQRLERSGFQHYYRRKSSEEAPLHSRHSNKPGYWMNKRSAILGPYREALLEGHFDNPDQDAIEELRQYQMGLDGEPYHVASKDKTDPTGAGSAHGDRCFVKGTMILTDRGERPIEQLIPGDLVWTRDGLRPVFACGKTGEEQVFNADLSNGRSLIGTGRHPVWTENRSWIDFSSLTSRDRLLAWQRQHSDDEVRSCQQNQSEGECTSATQARKPLCLMGGSTTETPMPSKSTGEGISGAGENMATARRPHSMSLFGSIITDLFQKVIWYITKTIARVITTSPIFSVSPIQSTERFTETANTWTTTDTKRFIGISANGVASITRPSENSEHGSVAPSADKSIYARAVKSVAGKHAVYNLSVANTPEYFAQGVLVHNCIADGLAWHACLMFGDQHVGNVWRNTANVMSATEDNVPRESFAWRRAQYLKMLRKKKLETTW